MSASTRTRRKNRRPDRLAQHAARQEARARHYAAVERETSVSVVNDDLLPPPQRLPDRIAMIMAVLVPPAATILAMVGLWRYGWFDATSFVVMFGLWLLSELGVTIGFHRLMSHRSFETYRWVRLFWMMAGAMSVEGSPLVWCAVHRKHHARSDKLGDPHSPHLHGSGFWGAVRGFWHAHTGWLFTGHWSYPNLERYVPDLLKDRWLVSVDKFYYLCVLGSLLLPAAIVGLISGTWKGALLGLLWGGVVRTFIGHHVTWSINSFTHLFGSRDYDSGDESRNNFICGVLAQGEGWHNNHHAFPTSARHGLEWWQFDMSWYVIRTMELLGLAWNVQLPSERALASKRINPPA